MKNMKIVAKIISDFQTEANNLVDNFNNARIDANIIYVVIDNSQYDCAKASLSLAKEVLVSMQVMVRPRA